jgi:hypothetical protein
MYAIGVVTTLKLNTVFSAGFLYPKELLRINPNPFIYG